MSAPIKPTATAYSRQRAARNLRLAEWMELDPALLIDIEDSDPDPTTHGSVVVTWRTMDRPLSSPRGHAHPDQWSNTGDGDITQVVNAATLDWDLAAEMLAVVGPKPELLTPEQKAALGRLR